MNVMVMHPEDFRSHADHLVEKGRYSLAILTPYFPVGQAMMMDWEPDQIEAWVHDLAQSIEDLS